MCAYFVCAFLIVVLPQNHIEVSAVVGNTGILPCTVDDIGTQQVNNLSSIKVSSFFPLEHTQLWNDGMELPLYGKLKIVMHSHMCHSHFVMYFVFSPLLSHM